MNKHVIGGFGRLGGMVVILALVGCRGSGAAKPVEAEKEKRVTAIGGVFFTVKDPAKTKQWYQKHLGLQTDEWGTNFEWRQADDPSRRGFTQWSPWKKKMGANQTFMINYRVQNMERLVEQLRAEGVRIVDEIKPEPYGKFVHIQDGDGNIVELWEPDDVEYEKMVGGRTK